MRQLRLVALLAGVSALAGTLPTTTAQDAKGEWVTIKGQVVMTKAPEKKKVDVTTDKEHCLSQGQLVYEDLVVNPKGSGVKNVVVWLRPDTTNRRDPFPQNKIHPNLAKPASKKIEVDQPCCQFVPRVVAARAGDTIEFKNSAPVNHNVNFNAEGQEFNNNLAPNTSKTTGPLQASPSPLTFKCDIHPWMQGRGRVFDHPYFAVTDAEGKFEIKDAPAGKWRLVYWHENGFHKGREGAIGLPVDTAEAKGNTLELKPVDLELPK